MKKSAPPKRIGHAPSQRGVVPHALSRDQALAQVRSATGDEPVSYRHDFYLGGTIDGRYKAEALLGIGRVGVVYRCLHVLIGRYVALKVLRAEPPGGVERYLKRVVATGSVDSPHVTSVTDHGQLVDGTPYFVMEYLSGLDLSAVIARDGRFPVERIVHVAKQLAEGLKATHIAGIVHGALTPEDIFLVDRNGDKDFVKLADFGGINVSDLAQAELAPTRLLLGTPSYMSPELIARDPLDQRSDVYSLGVILYELASGHVPFDGSALDVLHQHLHQPPAPLSSFTAARRDLDAIVLKCLAKRPEDRYQSMEELIVDLDRLRSGEVPKAVRGECDDTRPTLPPPVPRVSDNAPRQTALPMAVVAALIGMLIANRAWPGSAGVAFLVVLAVALLVFTLILGRATLASPAVTGREGQ